MIRQVGIWIFLDRQPVIKNQFLIHLGIEFLSREVDFSVRNL